MRRTDPRREVVVVTEQPQTARPSVWRHRDFLLLWGGQSVSETGSAVTQLALPLVAIVVLHATTFEVAVLTALVTVAFLLVSLPAGAIVDRLPKRQTMLVCDVARGLLLVSIPVAAVTGRLTMWQLYAVALVFGVFTVVFDVAYQSYLPAVLPKALLVDGNGKLGTTASLAGIIGPGIGGALVGLFGPAKAIIVDTASFVFSAVTLGLIRTVEPPAGRSAARSGSMRVDIAEGLSFVTRHRILRKVVACTGTYNFFSSFVAATETIFLIRIIRVTPATLGIVFAAMGAGGVVGGLVSGRLSKRVGSARIIWVSVAGLGWTNLLMPLAQPGWRIWLFVAGAAGSSAGSVIYNTAQVSYRQAITPPALLGRMNASVRWIVWGTMPLGALVGGALATRFGVRTTIWAGAAGCWAAALWVVLSPLLRMRDFDADEIA